jgi:arylsulfatase A
MKIVLRKQYVFGFVRSHKTESDMITRFVTALCIISAALPALAAGKPNIVIVLTDDLGYGDVSFLNAESKVKTPHMDALAKAGVWATDAHSPSTVCSPSRYAMLTGRYSWRTKIGRLDPWKESAIENDRVTLPKILKSKGYFTACVGKWHLGFDWPWKGGKKPPASVIGKGTSKATCDHFDWSKPIKGGPLGAGFDYYFGDDVPNMPPYAFIENDRLTCDPVDVNGRDLMKQQIMSGGYIHGVGPGEKGWRLDKVMPAITAKAVETIQTQSKTPEPFFLLFATTSPHSPIVPQPAFQGISEAGPYGDYIAQTDGAVGQVVAALKAAGVYENTLLVVSSDNGPAPFMRELIRSQQHHPSGPLRGLKRDLLEGGHRVPFIASWPQGGVSGGRRIDATLSLTCLPRLPESSVCRWKKALPKTVWIYCLRCVRMCRSAKNWSITRPMARRDSGRDSGPICARVESPRSLSGTRRCGKATHSMHPHCCLIFPAISVSGTICLISIRNAASGWRRASLRF